MIVEGDPPPRTFKLSVIVPMLNEEGAIVATLEAIRRGAPSAEVIVVDGGSSDRSCEAARPLCDLLLASPPGRARQMNLGARRASGDVLAFVHADTIAPAAFYDDIRAALGDARVVGGRFDIALDDPSLACRLIGAMISIRSRLSRTSSGDQAIFARRAIFEQLGGYRDIELCEDLDFAWRLKRAGRIACMRSRVITSARRWRNRGLVRTVVLMWAIRALFLMGVSPRRLSKLYGAVR